MKYHTVALFILLSRIEAAKLKLNPNKPPPDFGNLSDIDPRVTWSENDKLSANENPDLQRQPFYGTAESNNSILNNGFIKETDDSELENSSNTSDISMIGNDPGDSHYLDMYDINLNSSDNNEPQNKTDHYDTITNENLGNHTRSLQHGNAMRLRQELQRQESLETVDIHSSDNEFLNGAANDSGFGIKQG